MLLLIIYIYIIHKNKKKQYYIRKYQVYNARAHTHIYTISYIFIIRHGLQNVLV